MDRLSSLSQCFSFGLEFSQEEAENYMFVIAVLT